MTSFIDLYKKHRKKIPMDNYQLFFLILFIFGFMAPLFGMVGIAISHEPNMPHSLLGRAVMLLTCSLGMIIIAMGGSPGPSAKELFWLWIGFYMLIVTLSVIGVGEILLYKKLFD